MANEGNLKPPWKPGQSGNPGGYSNGRRVANAIAKLMDKLTADDDIGLAVVALSTGKRRLLKDDEEEGGMRKPDIAWYHALRDSIDGPLPKSAPEESDDDAIAEELRRRRADREST